MTDDGELLFFDRVKDMRRLANGHSYPPQFIETRLRYSPFIKDLMTLGDEARDFRQRADQYRHGSSGTLG